MEQKTSPLDTKNKFVFYISRFENVLKVTHQKKWTLLEVANDNLDALSQLERSPFVDGEPRREELDQFKDIVEDCKPTSATNLLIDYFDKVKVIYAFQMLNAAFVGDN